MRLQYKLSNGNFIDVDGENTLIEAAVRFDKKYPDTFHGKRGLQSNDDAIEALSKGKILRYGSDWYNQIRDGEAHVQKVANAIAKREADPNYSNEGWELDCGCIVHYKSHIMSSSSGSSCSDCYDRMSN